MLPSEKGKIGEDLAVKYLRNAGYEIAALNFRTRRGEVDIIARKKDELRFIEVRLRRKDAMVPPAESIIKKKKKRIISAAKEYLYRNKIYYKKYCHFDVIAVDEEEDYHIEYIPDAFDGNI